MNLRNRTRPAHDDLAAFRPRQPAPRSRPSHSRARQKQQGYRDFHPVYSTLVILGCGTVAFLIATNLTYFLIRTFKT